MSLLVQAAEYVGNFALNATVYFKFSVTDATGVLTTLGGTPVVKVYKDNGTTESTAGVTLTVDFDSRTGLCQVAIDTSSDGAFYAAGHDFEAVLTAGTVGVVSVAGTPVGHFSLLNRVDTLADGVTHGGTTAIVALNYIEILSTTSGKPGIGIQTSDAVGVSIGGGNDHEGLLIQGDGVHAGMKVIGGALGHGLHVLGGSSKGNAFYCQGRGNLFESSGISTVCGNGSGIFAYGGSGTRHAVVCEGGDSGGQGLQLYGVGSYNALALFTDNADAIHISPSGGHGININGSGSGKHGILVTTDINGDAVHLAGLGHDLNLAGSADILGNLTGTINGLTAAALATLFTVDSTKVNADAVTGSLVKEIAAHVTMTAAGLDAVLIESGITAGAGLTNDAGSQLTSINLRQAVALAISVLEGVLAGAAGTTVTTKPAGKPSGNTRVSATVDSDGNRSALTLKVPT